LNYPVNIFGYYNHNNAGDEAFSLFFRNVFRGHPVNFINHKEQLPAVDRLILGGGAVLNDYFFERLPEFKKLDVIGCSSDTDDSDLDHLARISDKLGIVALRSERDAIAAQSLGVNAEYFPDIVFGLNNPKPTLSLDAVAKLGELPTASEKEKQSAVIFLSDHYSVRQPGNDARAAQIEKYKQELAASFDALSSEYNLIFIPMSIFHNARDYVFAHDVVSRMANPERAIFISRYFHPASILDIVTSIADVVISMRLHGLIFGIVCRKPTINIGDGRKNIDLMFDSSLDEFSIPVSTITRDRMVSTVKSSPRAKPHIEALASKNHERVQPLIARLREAYGPTHSGLGRLRGLHKRFTS
jgi:polysaccharide pyruvyl transferase WcaK-like protein